MRPIVLALTALFPAMALAQVADRPLSQPGIASSAQISPQEAADKIVRLLREWDDQHPGPSINPLLAVPIQIYRGPFATLSGTRKFTQTDVDALAASVAGMGLANLLAVTPAADARYGGDLRPLLTKALWAAVDHMAGDGDLALLLQAAHTDAAFFPLIENREAWRTRPEVLTALGSGLDHANGGLSADIEESGPEIKWDSDATGDFKGADNTVEETLDAAETSGDPGLAKKINTLLQDAGQNGDSYNFSAIQGMLEFCTNPGRDSYSSNVPQLLAALLSDKFHHDLETNRAYWVAKLDMFLTRQATSSLCGKPEMQDAIHRLAEPGLHDENRNNAALSLSVLARVGDQDRFDKLVRAYLADRRGTDSGNQLSVEQAVLDSVIYQGPADRYKGILEHASLCQFDPARGRWVLTVEGYENQPAISNVDHPNAP
jgi:hypothetical protein